MISKIEPPRMDVKDNVSSRDQIKELRKYLFKLVENINYTLGEIERNFEKAKEE